MSTEREPTPEPVEPSAWLCIPGSGLKRCPRCREVALEGEAACSSCGCEPEDDTTWRAWRTEAPEPVERERLAKILDGMAAHAEWCSTLAPYAEAVGATNRVADGYRKLRDEAADFRTMARILRSTPVQPKGEVEARIKACARELAGDVPTVEDLWAHANWRHRYYTTADILRAHFGDASDSGVR